MLLRRLDLSPWWFKFKLASRQLLHLLLKGHFPG